MIALRSWVVVLAVTVYSNVGFSTEYLYNRDIRPILSDACFACHGPDSASRKADLRLDQRDAAIAGGAIVPGKPDESTMIQRIMATDADVIMPPPESHKVLTPEQKKVLVDWIASGAEYQPHWSFIPPTIPDLPEVRNKEWVKNPIDRFILSRLESMGIEPAPEADIRTLVRRASLDLIGLPPTPEEVDAVVMDPSPDRYERYVDKLLEKEQWGEHRARYWLDYARYADTHGIHFDNYREMWSYRDWVIDAFNRNLPFDQFTVEQLAGDLLPNPTMDQRIATGFHRCNITTNEGGIIDEEYVVLYARDRTETTAQVWLGLTANCAVCHDHKFDPITARDFYSMSAFFNNTTQGPRDGNQKDTPPIIPVPRRQDRARFQELSALIPAATQAVEQQKNDSRPGFQAWLTSPSSADEMVWGEETQASALQFQLPLMDASESNTGAWVHGQLRRVPIQGKPQWAPGYVGDQAWVNQDQVSPFFPSAGDLERDRPFSISFWMKRPANGMVGAVLARMDDPNTYRGWDVWLENDRIGMHFIHAWPQNAIKFVSNQGVPADSWHHVAITYDASSKAAGFQVYIDGNAVGVTPTNDSLTESTRTNVPMRLGRRNQLSPTPGVALNDLRIYSAKLESTEVVSIKNRSRSSYLVAKNQGQRSEAETEELFAWYLNSKDEAYRQKSQALAALQAEKRDIEVRGTIAHVMHERNEPAKAFVLHRGEYDQRRDEVTPMTPAALPQMSPDLPKNRLGLAQWLLAKENPLTARVTVNRFWQEIFGVGIVPTAGDFGITGLSPTHPELLDYLAVTFRDNGWDMKAMYRMLVTSAAYRQSGLVTPEKLASDPENRLVSRGPRYRIDAEMVRDYALACSGLLSKTIGGPSVRPYQPTGVWEAVAMPESNTRFYKEDEGESLYRRSMYTFWKRAAPPASMEILNAPNRETCTVRRERTNTPIQAWSH